MKKILLLVTFIALSSCDMKDKQGNAPLIDDGTGKLIDNPNYHTDNYYEVEEEYQGKTPEEEVEMAKLQNNMKRFADSLKKADKK